MTVHRDRRVTRHRHRTAVLPWVALLTGLTAMAAAAGGLAGIAAAGWCLS